MSDIEYSCLAQEADSLIPLTPGGKGGESWHPRDESINLGGGMPLGRLWEDLDHDQSREGYATENNILCSSRSKERSSPPPFIKDVSL